jgi:hypothetical protein
MDRLDAMSVLLAVVEAGSLSAASRRLGTPLATISRKISELESHLKAKLLHRSTRQMTRGDPISMRADVSSNRWRRPSGRQKASTGLPGAT